MHRLLILLYKSYLLTFRRLGNLHLLLDWDKDLSTVRLLNDLVLDLLRLLSLLLLLLNNNRLLRYGLLLGHLWLLRELLHCLLLDAARLVKTIFLLPRLLHQRVDVSFCLPFHSQGCVVNQSSSDCRRWALHLLTYCILKSSDAVKALKVFRDLLGVSCHLDGLAVHELEVVFNDPPAVILAHVAILSRVKLKHIMRGRHPAFLPEGKLLLLLPRELGAEVDIYQAHEFVGLAKKGEAISVFWTKASLCLVHSQDLCVGKRPERKFLLKLSVEADSYGFLVRLLNLLGVVEEANTLAKFQS